MAADRKGNLRTRVIADRRVLVLAVLLILCRATGASWADATAWLSPVTVIPLNGVSGRIDHLAIDVKGNRLFVCALGSDSVEVIDVKSGSVATSIRGLSEPQGVFYLPELNRIYVTNAGSGECDVYDGSSYRLLERRDLGGDADNLHFDSSARRLYVSARNGLSIMDVADGKVVGTITLPGHPEGFALEQKGPRIFVNVPLPSRSVFVVDRAAGKVTGRWPVGGLLSDAYSNFPMALDETDGRLFVATRVPPSLKVLDISTGEVVTGAGVDGDADDIFYDSARRRIYISCGAGFLDVFEQVDPDHYREAARIHTAAGGRTSLWVPELGRLFVAVPRADNTPAQIRVYSAD